MAIQVTSSRLPISPDTPVAGVYAAIPKDSVAYLPGNGSWAFQIRYYINADARKAEKVYEYFRSLDAKPEEWTEAQWAKSQAVKVIQVAAVFAIDTQTTDNLGITDPANITEALTQIYAWVKLNCEPGAQDILSDPSISDLISAYFISAGV